MGVQNMGWGFTIAHFGYKPFFQAILFEGVERQYWSILRGLIIYLVSSRGHKIRSVAFQKLYDPPLDAELNVDSENGLNEDQL